AAPASRAEQGSALSGGRRGRCRRSRGLLPAPRRSRGLRPPTRSRRHPERPGIHLGRDGCRGRDDRLGPSGGGVRGTEVTATASQSTGDAGTWGGQAVRSYHGQQVLKEPVWTWEIPCYFFMGGLG